MTEERFDIAVIGAGLAGLAAAAGAAETGRHVVLLDAHRPAAGPRSTTANGYRFNRGPRALYVGGAGAEVLRHFGVRTDPGGAPTLDGVMLRRDGELHRQPVGVGSLLRTTLLSAREKAQAARPARRHRTHRRDASSSAPPTRDWIDGSSRGRVADLLETLVRITTYTNAPDCSTPVPRPASVQPGNLRGRPLPRRRLPVPGRRDDRRDQPARRPAAHRRRRRRRRARAGTASGVTGPRRRLRRRLGRRRRRVGPTPPAGCSPCRSAAWDRLGPAVDGRLPRARPAAAARPTPACSASTSRST